jgi:hypothetical protein
VLDKVRLQQAPDPSTGIDIDPSAFDARRRAHRLRRSLKESGDFLGVQGINPQTGELDVLTPTSPSRSGSSSQELAKAITSTDAMYAGAEDSRFRLGQLQKEQAKWDRDELRKDSIRAFQRRVRWRKRDGGWSSAAEPELSPIESMGSGELGKAPFPYEPRSELTNHNCSGYRNSHGAQ